MKIEYIWLTVTNAPHPVPKEVRVFLGDNKWVALNSDGTLNLSRASEVKATQLVEAIAALKEEMLKLRKYDFLYNPPDTSDAPCPQ